VSFSQSNTNNFYVVAKTQQSELTNNTWYLEKIIIGTEEYYAPKNNYGPSVSTTLFHNAHFSTGMCNSLSGDISYDNQNDTFTLIGLSSTLIDCFDKPEIMYCEYIYFSKFFNFGYDYYNPFSYNITPEGNALKLTVTNNKGDQAIYYSTILAVDNTVNNDFKVYPNPAKDILNIETSIKIDKINVYDASGKMVKTLQNIGKTMDVSRLKNGVYHLEIFTDKGKFYEKILIDK
jgi:heat shock protein HslJ